MSTDDGLQPREVRTTDDDGDAPSTAGRAAPARGRTR